MFLIGFLSSPLPYLLVAFVYLLGFSWGLFSKNEDKTLADELIPSIVNYEVLSATQVEIADNANYTDFLTEKNNSHSSQIFSFYFNLSCTNYNTVSLSGDEPLLFNYFYTAKLFNRPPPIA